MPYDSLRELSERPLMSEKSPEPVDVYVGSRLRLRRILVGFSQEKLAEHLGLTFQQIQKYEKGTNRVSASRLYQVANVLSVPVQYFFDGIPGQDAPMKPTDPEAPESHSELTSFLSSSEGLQLNRAFAEISDLKIRRKIVELVKTLSGHGGGATD